MRNQDQPAICDIAELVQQRRLSLQPLAIFVVLDQLMIQHQRTADTSGQQPGRRRGLLETLAKALPQCSLPPRQQFAAELAVFGVFAISGHQSVQVMGVVGL